MTMPLLRAGLWLLSWHAGKEGCTAWAMSYASLRHWGPTQERTMLLLRATLSVLVQIDLIT